MVDVMCSEISNSVGTLVTGMNIPISPMQQGKAKSSLSCLPINAGMNDCLMASFIGCKKCWGLCVIGSSTCYTDPWSELCRQHGVDFLRSLTASQSRSSTSLFFFET